MASQEVKLLHLLLNLPSIFIQEDLMQNRPLSFSVDIKLNERRNLANFDYSIVLAVLLLGLFGLAMIYSASGSYALVLRQAMYFLLGIILMITAAISNFRKMEPIYLNAVWIGFFFLVLVLVLPNSGNTNRWINLGFIGFQPSELMRFLLPISAAAYLTRNPQIKFSDWMIVIVATLLAFILVFLQPDFGTSAIVLLSGIMPIILSGLPWRFIIYSFLGGIGTLPFLWISLMDYQKERIFTFISPEADALGSGWNIAQSKIAIGSGQFLGKGYMEGSQSQLDFIPESHTDFIFAVIVEEFGFIGALGLFLLYAFLIHRLLYVAKSSNSKFAKLVAATLSIILAAYITLNISMVVGIFPVVGMPLPFISQGGTALVVNMITIGIILSLRRTT
jgi:rod shape determining protein RodA